VEESLLKGHPVARVPWGIDTDVYRPLGRAACRQMLGIPPGKKVLLFGVADFRIFLKGGDLFREALGRLPQSVKKDLMLLLFGNGGRAFAQSEDVGVMDLGYISSDPLKAIAYSSADLLVHPTRADNSPCTVIESLACGTPVVSFRVGGVPELVRPGETGWLAPPEDAAGLARAITEALEDDLRRFRVGERSREFAVSEHSLDAYAENYLAVYRRAVERFHGRKAPVRDPDGSRVDEPVTERVH
jgi:glycosyltransferase involved in cell wall biosynthesis